MPRNPTPPAEREAWQDAIIRLASDAQQTLGKISVFAMPMAQRRVLLGEALLTVKDAITIYDNNQPKPKDTEVPENKVRYKKTWA